ncbi:hypothetical protein PV11_04808 [Exophiala sideris]|uniref:Uncharacterized protein n=1 Tax=Exophiala sideris TaxID=1016849 RepID=A0A0D1YIK7_9EURO|nr:hypothetical protein PV11_04808 [Exophiala sideris]
MSNPSKHRVFKHSVAHSPSSPAAVVMQMLVSSNLLEPSYGPSFSASRAPSRLHQTMGHAPEGFCPSASQRSGGLPTKSPRECNNSGTWKCGMLFLKRSQLHVICSQPRALSDSEGSTTCPT